MAVCVRVKRSTGTYLLSCKMIFCLLERYCACVGGISDLRVIKIWAHVALGLSARGRRADQIESEKKS